MQICDALGAAYRPIVTNDKTVSNIRNLDKVFIGSLNDAFIVMLA